MDDGEPHGHVAIRLMQEEARRLNNEWRELKETTLAKMSDTERNAFAMMCCDLNEAKVCPLCFLL